MPFLRITVLSKLFIPIIILSLLTFSCSTDNSITGGSDQTNLSKPIDLTDIYSKKPQGGGKSGTDNLINAIEKIWKKIEPMLKGADKNSQELCGVSFYLGSRFAYDPNNDLHKNANIAYDFRDNYLVETRKGQAYTASYYLLSIYGIENNLLMKHSMEILSLMNTGIEVSQELQHGTNDNKILINKTIYDNCKNIVKIYRDSENHNDIEPVLQYLEADLEKYYNKNKAEIAADFGY